MEMQIETCAPAHLFAPHRLGQLDDFLRRTAFVLCHKTEPIDTVLNLLRYLPAESPVVIVSNCPMRDYEELRHALDSYLAGHPAAYVAHQKDEHVAHFFRELGVSQILDASGRVVDGKGEGMYIGALLATLLRTPAWIVYFDADNYAPSALLEYTLAMAHCFMETPREVSATIHPLLGGMPGGAPDLHGPALHNVRVCWASKPSCEGDTFVPQERVVGRCTRVIAPLCDTLVQARQPTDAPTLLTPNAGEQGMTMATARALRFSSGFSIETFQLLELFFLASARRGERAHTRSRVLLQQYLAGSPHFHEKKDDAHIRGMIAESLGAFLVFRRQLPAAVLEQLRQVARDLALRVTRPTLYPALAHLPLSGHEALLQPLRVGVHSAETVIA